MNLRGPAVSESKPKELTGLDQKVRESERAQNGNPSRSSCSPADSRHLPPRGLMKRNVETPTSRPAVRAGEPQGDLLAERDRMLEEANAGL